MDFLDGRLIGTKPSNSVITNDVCMYVNTDSDCAEDPDVKEISFSHKKFGQISLGGGGGSDCECPSMI